MSSRNFKENKEWYLGLDVGTSSVGWAVTDKEYNILKFKNNATWGVYLFDEAKTSAERRKNRTDRRRLERRKQRITLLQELMARDIVKVDENFYLRIKESGLWAEDRKTDPHLFVGSLSDKEYNQKYPTIHHLIMELINNDEYHDPRLVYMACSYILSHRGHFLLDIDKDKADSVTDFNPIFGELMQWFVSNEIDKPWECDADEISNILMTNNSKLDKAQELKEKVSGKSKEINYKSFVDIICGKKVKLSNLFNKDEYKELEEDSIEIYSEEKFLKLLEINTSTLMDEEISLLISIKNVYDWSVLVKLKNGKKYISEAKVDIYNQHKNDLNNLKYIIGKYCPSVYDDVFRNDIDNNYVKYSCNYSDFGKLYIPKDGNIKDDQEAFCKFIENKLKSINCEMIEEDDQKRYKEIISKTASKTLCPKQMTTDNRVIPYQLYYVELRAILDNAKKYMECLNDVDKYGTTYEKILSLMSFKIPYYVGPLNSSSEFAWIERRNNEKIFPWNFTDVVDLDASEEEFIKRMTAKCTYLAGKDVLPKNSLLYSKFEVLNEINNIKIDGIKIPPKTKQEIFEELFMKKRKVSVKDIKDFLLSKGLLNSGNELQGLDTTIKSSLASYHDFKCYSDLLSEKDIEHIILLLTLSSDRKRTERKLIENYNISKDDAKKISKFKYKDFGRISRELFTEVLDIDCDTGEVRNEQNIIQRMWDTNENLMELLSNRYGYADHISFQNEDYYSNRNISLDEELKNMYISNAVKRPILRTLEIVKELKKINGRDPQKIFIEMARGASDKQKGKRTKPRKDQIKELYKSYDKQEVANLVDLLDSKTDSELRSDKLFLYFTQLGKCMYSGEPINIEDLYNDALYNVDHIWPQSKIKDDSLDNRVLVKSEINGNKDDIYPIPVKWRKKQHDFWKSLHDKKLVSDKKYERLTRSTPFTDEELAQFIERQLVETRQSTKALARILNRYVPDSEIVYVKAGLVSEFRNEYKERYTLKCREINDLHHAKDAYLNIVIGNAYNVKYTKNPITFIKSGEKYSLKTKNLLEHDVVRNNEIAWKSANGVWLDRVISTLHKNNIRFVRYSYEQKGKLFKGPDKRGKDLYPRKKDLFDVSKYGGYNSLNCSEFYFVKHLKKGKETISLVPITIVDKNKLEENSLKCLTDYFISNGYENAVILLRGRSVKYNTLFEIKGKRVHFCGKGSKTQINFKSAQQLVLEPELEEYARKIIKCQDRKNQSFEITEVKNNELFNVLLSKLYKFGFITEIYAKYVEENKDKYLQSSRDEQIEKLREILAMFNCNNSQGTNVMKLCELDKKKQVGKILINIDVSNNIGHIYIIDQSPTGLFEVKTGIME